jgi:hypothetical protein
MIAKVVRLSSNCTLHPGGLTRVSAVKQLGYDAPEAHDDLLRNVLLGKQRGAALSRDAHVPDRPSGRDGELLDRLGERQSPRLGRLANALCDAAFGVHRDA